MPKNSHGLMANSINNRVAVYLAFIASALLWFVVYSYMDVIADVPHPPPDQGAGWLVMFLGPFLLVIWASSIRSGYRIGGKWRAIGWLPMLLGLSGSLLIINTMS